jgi:hypothetical protein
MTDRASLRRALAGTSRNYAVFRLHRFSDLPLADRQLCGTVLRTIGAAPSARADEERCERRCHPPQADHARQRAFADPGGPTISFFPASREPLTIR